jgi:hypothetical protein
MTMSAFIVAPETMDAVVSSIIADPGLAAWGRKFAGVLLCDPEAAQAIGDKHYEMNRAAVDYRYEEKNEQPVYQARYRVAGTVAAFKATQCLLYQCHEGEIPQSPIYRALEGHLAGLANDIISRTPDYEKAQWG